MGLFDAFKKKDCEICGKEKRQRTADEDDINTIIEISKNDDFIFGK